MDQGGRYALNWTPAVGASQGARGDRVRLSLFILASTLGYFLRRRVQPNGVGQTLVAAERQVKADLKMVTPSGGGTPGD